MASYDKFADDTAAKLKKLGGKSKSDEGDDTEVEVKVSAKKKPGALGKLLISAVRQGDGEAVEEAVRNMCEGFAAEADDQPEEPEETKTDDNE